MTHLRQPSVDDLKDAVENHITKWFGEIAARNAAAEQMATMSNEELAATGMPDPENERDNAINAIGVKDAFVITATGPHMFSAVITILRYCTNINLQITFPHQLLDPRKYDLDGGLNALGRMEGVANMVIIKVIDRAGDALCDYRDNAENLIEGTLSDGVPGMREILGNDDVVAPIRDMFTRGLITLDTFNAATGPDPVTDKDDAKEAGRERPRG